MLLAIDVGNTNVVLGVFDGEELVNSWRLATLGERTADELGILVSSLFLDRNIDRSQITGVFMASVVPPLTGTITTMVEQYLGLQVQLVEATTDIGMPVRYDNPKEVGAARLVNGVAAFERHGRAKNVRCFSTRHDYHELRCESRRNSSGRQLSVRYSQGYFMDM